jgi:hypothetical protein
MCPCTLRQQSPITSTDGRSAVGDPKNLFNFPTLSLQAPDLSLVSS